MDQPVTRIQALLALVLVCLMVVTHHLATQPRVYIHGASIPPAEWAEAVHACDGDPWCADKMNPPE